MNIEIKTNIADSIQILVEVGRWMKELGLENYSKWWDPDTLSKDFFKPYADPNEFFVVYVNNKPAATALLQTKQNLQDWSSIDGNKIKQAIYIAYIAVKREYSGQNLVNTIIDKATQLAQDKGIKTLRLDTNHHEPKLCELYESLGFHLVGTETIGDSSTAFYESKIP